MFCRTVWFNLAHEHTPRGGDPQGLREVPSEILRINPQVASYYFSVASKFADDSSRKIDRDSKPDAGRSRVVGGVYPDHLSIHVYKGSAAVSRIDRGVGLEKVLERGGRDIALDRVQPASFCTDNTHTDRMIQTERTSYRHHPVTDLDRIRIAEVCNIVRVDPVVSNRPDQAQIRFRILSYDFRRKVSPVGKGYLYSKSLVDHVIVGEDMPLSVDNEARAVVPRGGATPLPSTVDLVSACLADRDTYDGRSHLLCDLNKRARVPRGYRRGRFGLSRPESQRKPSDDEETRGRHAFDP